MRLDFASQWIALPPPDPTFKSVGRTMIVGGVLAAIGAIVVRDDPAIAAIAVGAALFLGSMVTLLAGPPLTDRGRPSTARIGGLFLAGVFGLVVQALSSPIVALGIASVSFVIMILSSARRPASRPSGDENDAARLSDPGNLVTAAGLFLFILALCLAGVAGAT